MGEWWSSGELPEHAEFRQADGLELLESIDWMATVATSRDGVLANPDRVVIYCDPPYRLDTRTSDSGIASTGTIRIMPVYSRWRRGFQRRATGF